jgi:ACS family hexuronate transporter-like MFS transporter
MTLNAPVPFKLKHLRWWIVGLLLCATMINYLDRQALSVAAPVIREKFSMTNADYSLIVQAFLLSYAIMQPIAGRIIDWLGTRVGFSLAVLWWGLANILTALASGVGSFRVFRFLLGVGEAGNFPASIKTVAEWFPAKERALATGVFNMGAGLGAIVAPPMIGWLIITYGWLAGFVATGILTLVWAPLWYIFYRRPHEHPWLASEELAAIRAGQEEAIDAGAVKGSWKEMLTHKELWGCMIAKFLTDPVWWFYLFWLPDYLHSARGFSIKEIAMFAWLPFVTADIGCIFGGAISSFFIKRGMKVITARKAGLCICALMMPIALIAARVNNPYLALACISLATMGHQSWSSNLLTLPADLFPKRQVATAYGLAGAAGSWGGVVFTTYVGVWIDKFGYVPVFTLVGLLHLIAAGVVLLMIKERLGATEPASYKPYPE